MICSIHGTKDVILAQARTDHTVPTWFNIA